MPFQVAADDIYEQVKSAFQNDTSGAYRLHVYDFERGLAVPVSRALGADEDGVLYIGCSTHVPSRVASLVKGLNACFSTGKWVDLGAHSAATKLSKRAALMDKFPFSLLAISVHPCVVTDEDLMAAEGRHFEAEGALFSPYIAKFGETPPLNG